MVSGVASETRDANMTWTDISKTDTVMTRRYPLSMVDAVCCERVLISCVANVPGMFQLKPVLDTTTVFEFLSLQ